MKDKIEVCRKCEELLDKMIKSLETINDNIYIKIEKFIIDNYEMLKNEREYKVLMIKYILLKEREK